MSEQDAFHKEDPTERKYILKCRPQVKKLWVEDAGRKYQSTIMILVPEHNDQCSQFFSAWLPDEVSEHYEMGSYIHSPVMSPARLSIHRRNENCSEHHLTVMSKGVADEIEKYMMNKVLTVEILPASMELESLNSKESNNDYTRLDI